LALAGLLPARPTRSPGAARFFPFPALLQGIAVGLLLAAGDARFAALIPWLAAW